MNKRGEDICPQPAALPDPPPRPLSPPVYFSSVYRCDDPAQAGALLSGAEAGYVYSRDGHPNADMLAEKCRELHGAEHAAIAASGMAAAALILLSQLEQGDHVVVSSQLYGATQELFTAEAARCGIASTVVDTQDLKATRAAFIPTTRLLVVETIANPILRVADIPALADLAHAHQALLLVDNTFASPILCRPLELGADLVLESLTKIMNGHSDLVLGLVCGSAKHWTRVPRVLSRWGLASSPMDCWLALRGIATLALRAEHASANALEVARFLTARPEIAAVHYPGLPGHPDHAVAKRQFGKGFGSVVTFTLRGGLPAAETFIRGSQEIPFCPSLGELSTTLSHPASTSHRGLTDAARAKLGIDGGTIRLSVGIESPVSILASLDRTLASLSAGN